MRTGIDLTELHYRPLPGGTAFPPVPGGMDPLSIMDGTETLGQEPGSPEGKREFERILRWLGVGALVLVAGWYLLKKK